MEKKTKKDLLKELNRMGKGWFILRLSNELLKTDYAVNVGYKASSVKTKENTFKKALSNAKELIDLVLKSSNKKICHKSLCITHTKIIEIGTKLNNELCVCYNFVSKN